MYTPKTLSRVKEGTEAKMADFCSFSDLFCDDMESELATPLSLRRSQDLKLFPELGLVDSNDLAEVSLPFDDGVELVNVTDSEEDFVNYLTSGRDHEIASSVGSMSPTETPDVFSDDTLLSVAPSATQSKPSQLIKVVKLVRMPNGQKNAVSRMEEAQPVDPSMTKNAIAARENRLKKKKYVFGLEQSVEELTGENKHLRAENKEMQRDIAGLRSQVKYLKSVLANQSTLSSLLKNIGLTPDVQFQASLDADDEEEADVGSQARRRLYRKRKANEEVDQARKEKVRKENVAHNMRLLEAMKSADHSYASDNAKADNSSSDEEAGICLHVKNKKVSLEFCSICSSRSSRLRQNKSLDKC